MNTPEPTPTRESAEPDARATSGGQAGPAAQPGWATQPQSAPPLPAAPRGFADHLPGAPTNTLSIITLVLGALGFALVPVITGHIALNQIKHTDENGHGITIAGLVLGYVALGAYALFAIVVFGSMLASYALHAPSFYAPS